jgi:hypothetical protein
MAGRERKRAERRKRKERGRQRASDMSGRSEARNAAVREELEPLHEGERPAVVTMAAVISTLVAVLSLAGYALWDVFSDDDRPRGGGVVVFVVVIGVMAYGLWRARYWAVLGFQAALVIVILSATLGTISALSVGLAVGNFVLLIGAGVLFYFMVKALARIQMPERLPPDR